jgi:hypothetical protein
MILGMSIATFTLVHVVLSLIGIVSGLIAVVGMLGGRRLDGWTALFLATTVATSVTGFMFGSSFDPAQVIGIISLLALLVAIAALYAYRLGGAWRWLYVVSAVLALYLNCFVGVVQAFQKLPFLRPLAPTQSEPPFLVAQLLVMALFIVLGILGVRRFHPGATARA